MVLKENAVIIYAHNSSIGNQLLSGNMLIRLLTLNDTNLPDYISKLFCHGILWLELRGSPVHRDCPFRFTSLYSVTCYIEILVRLVY